MILGLCSVFATCNPKSVYFQLDARKSFAMSGRTIVACHWWQVLAPTEIIFDHQDSLVVNLTAKKPIAGLYIIGGTVTDNFGIKSDTTLSYILTTN